MCQIKCLKRTKNGMLLFCFHSELYQLMFKNINLNLTLNELECFITYIQNIDEQYWEHECRNFIYNKYIAIPSLQENLIILLDLIDLIELRILLEYRTVALKFFTFREIDYKMIMN